MFNSFRVLFVHLLLVTFVQLCVSHAQTGQSPAIPPYLDTAQPLNVRVDDLVSRMTLEEKASQLVNQARAIPRLQVPAYDWWSEALHGVANAGTATVFPEPIGLAATFDAPLIHEMAIVIGTEARSKHNRAVRAGRRDIMEGLDFWSPSTFSAIRAGGVARKPTVRTRFLPDEWVWPSSPACRATIRSTTG